MARFVFISEAGDRDEIEAPIGTSAMRAAVTRGIDGIVGECGGSLACGTCHVYVEPSQFGKLPTASDDEDAMLDVVASERRPNSRLSCQIIMSEALDGLVLRLPPDQH
jgi:2Fe-2S ferredoxin